MLDAPLIGADPAPLHVENVAWHPINALLQLIVPHRLSGSSWRAATAATWLARAKLDALFRTKPTDDEARNWFDGSVSRITQSILYALHFEGN